MSMIANLETGSKQVTNRTSISSALGRHVLGRRLKVQIAIQIQGHSQE
jgi:hypothetical protein